MSIHKVNYFSFLCYVYTTFLLFEAQLSLARSLSDVNSGSSELKLLFSSQRMLGDVHTSCYDQCFFELDRSTEGDTIFVDLGPSANYTLTFPITPAGGQNFSLKFIPVPDLNYRVWLQRPGSTDYLPVTDSLYREKEWLKLMVYDDTLDIYKNGKAILELVNFSDQSQTVTVKYNFEELTSLAIGLIFGLIIGAIIYVPLLICLLALLVMFIKFLRDQCIAFKNWCIPSSWAARRNRRNRQTRDENNLNQFAISLGVVGDGRQNQEIVNNDNENAKTLGLTSDTIDSYFPEAKFENFDNSFSQASCSICYEDLTKGLDCRQLYCKHIFHSECIVLWLQSELQKDKASCPNCNCDMRDHKL